MVKLIETIVQALVDHPDEVTVTEVTGKQCVVIEIETDRNDVGKVIGKRGSMASALRTIANAVGGREGRTYRIEVIED